MARIDCYCAFCKSPRKVYAKRRIGLVNILSSGIGAVLVMLAVFQEFDPRVFLIFVFFLAVSETFVQLRWRMAMVCKHCGFDPLIYLKSHEKAAQKVKAHLELRKKDPSSAFKAPLSIPKISKQRVQEIQAEIQTQAAQKQQLHAQQKGSLISRQI